MKVIKSWTVQLRLGMMVAIMLVAIMLVDIMVVAAIVVVAKVAVQRTMVNDVGGSMDYRSHGD